MDLLYENETYKIIGAAMEVHKELGAGFLEAVYQEALEKELAIQNIPFKREAILPIYYKNILLQKVYIADFICYDKIIVELKALSALNTEHMAQLLNYLKATDLKLGLLINFGKSSLEYKRIIRENPRNLRTIQGSANG
jgi:GxxExxY protein